MLHPGFTGELYVPLLLHFPGVLSRTYAVVADFEAYMRARPTHISAADIDKICVLLIADGLAELTSPILEPGVFSTTPATGNLIMAPFGKTLFSFIFYRNIYKRLGLNRFG